MKPREVVGGLQAGRGCLDRVDWDQGARDLRVCRSSQRPCAGDRLACSSDGKPGGEAGAGRGEGEERGLQEGAAGLAVPRLPGIFCSK